MSTVPDIIGKTFVLYFSAIIFSSGLSYAEDFHSIREAKNESVGKTLSSKDIILPAVFRPKSSDVDFFTSPGVREAKARYSFFSRAGSFYIVKPGKDTVCIAQGTGPIRFGESVSRHEFNTDQGYFVSPDSTRVAFYRKDESAVELFPFLEITRPRNATLPPGRTKLTRYPMNGKASEVLSLQIYDIASGSSLSLKVDDFTAERYLTNPCWSPDGKLIYVQVLDRHQQNMNLNCYDATDGSFVKTVLSEHSDTWFEPQNPLYWIKGSNSKAIYTSDNRDLWQNLYLVDVTTDKVQRLTVIDKHCSYVANDGKNVYFTAPDEHPVNNHLWRVSVKGGKCSCLTGGSGWHTITMAPDCRTFVDRFESLTDAPVSVLCSNDGKIIKTVCEASDPTEKWAFSSIEMGCIPSEDSVHTNYYRLVYPLHFDPSKKYPLILYVYGGPHSQSVRNTFLGGLRAWEMYAAQRGFAVLTLDNRGTSGQDTSYQKAIYRRCGHCEKLDQILGLRMIMDRPWVDSDRIGVYGWSYGGFMSLTMATSFPEVFKVAVAGGPVIDWRWYEVMYGERYMGNSVEHPEDFEANSLLNAAASLKSRTLVIYGANDDTVVPLNALSFIQACIDRGVEVDCFVYPKAPHNMRGLDRADLVRRITDYFIENL